MKQLFSLLGFAAIVLISCHKDGVGTSNQLNGTWRMVEVYDKNTGSTLIPPAKDGNDLVLSFTATGFTGHTLRNTIEEGLYVIPAINKVRFTAYSTTKVGEDNWGGILFTMLSSCSLQSVYPCTPLDFTINGNMLEIDTPFSYRIKLEKL